MSELAAQIMNSAKIISAPSGEAASVEKSPTTTPETSVPIVADVLGLGIFYGDNASEVVSPEMLSDVKSKVDAIIAYVRDNITTQSEDSVKEFVMKLSSENNWDSLKPTEKLEKFFDYIDLKKRLQEQKNLNTIIKGLRESVNA